MPVDSKLAEATVFLSDDEPKSRSKPFKKKRKPPKNSSTLYLAIGGGVVGTIAVILAIAFFWSSGPDVQYPTRVIQPPQARGPLHEPRPEWWQRPADNAPEDELELSGGTGFVIDNSGLILTNKHVIVLSERVFVYPFGVKDPIEAEVQATDPELDIAILRIQPKPGVELLPLSFSRRPHPDTAEEVATLGYPAGGSGLTIKFTSGQVGAVPQERNGYQIELNLKVNPGNSGGPLCDRFGHVAGIIYAKSVSDDPAVESFGFAMPASDAVGFLKRRSIPFQLANPGEPRPWTDVVKEVEKSIVLIVGASRRR